MMVYRFLILTFVSNQSIDYVWSKQAHAIFCNWYWELVIVDLDSLQMDF